jgi:hypothetical protein
MPLLTTPPQVQLEAEADGGRVGAAHYRAVAARVRRTQGEPDPAYALWAGRSEAQGGPGRFGLAHGGWYRLAGPACGRCSLLCRCPLPTQVAEFLTRLSADPRTRPTAALHMKVREIYRQCHPPEAGSGGRSSGGGGGALTDEEQRARLDSTHVFFEFVPH